VSQPFVELPASFHRVTRDVGDVLSRFEVRCDEVDVSLRLLADLVSREGPLDVRAMRSKFERVTARASQKGGAERLCTASTLVPAGFCPGSRSSILVLRVARVAPRVE